MRVVVERKRADRSESGELFPCWKFWVVFRDRWVASIEIWAQKTATKRLAEILLRQRGPLRARSPKIADISVVARPLIPIGASPLDRHFFRGFGVCFDNNFLLLLHGFFFVCFLLSCPNPCITLVCFGVLVGLKKCGDVIGNPGTQ